MAGRVLQTPRGRQAPPARPAAAVSVLPLLQGQDRVGERLGVEVELLDAGEDGRGPDDAVPVVILAAAHLVEVLQQEAAPAVVRPGQPTEVHLSFARARLVLQAQGVIWDMKKKPSVKIDNLTSASHSFKYTIVRRSISK